MNDVDVAAEFEVVPAANQADVIGELRAPFDAVHGGVRFTAEITIAGNVYADLIAAGQLRKSKMHAAARVLKAKGVERRGADYGVVFNGEIQIAGLIEACA